MATNAAKIAETVNGLHITCPNGSVFESEAEEPKGSRSSRQRSTRGRTEPFFIGVAGLSKAYLRRANQNWMSALSNVMCHHALAPASNN